MKKVTNADRLKTLQKHGFISKSVKTFNKSVRNAWSHFSDAFPSGRLYPNSTLLKGSKAVLKAAESVNMLVIGDKIVYPAGNTKVRVYETASRITFIQTKPSGHRDIIILGKDGDHLKAGLEYSKTFRNKKGVRHSWGTLKTHDVTTKKGLMVKGFMRDVAQTYDNPIDAMTDNRYHANDTEISLGDYMDDEKGFLSEVQKSNGVAALILTEY